MVTRVISVDFSRKVGKIKPLSGTIGGPRFSLDLGIDLTDVYRELCVPYVRTANIEAPHGGGRFVDIHNIFPDPALDPRMPESYNFAPTDKYFSAIKESGAEIFLRIGETPDEYEVKPHICPKMPPEKLAIVAEKIVAHYNLGWGGGFKFGIKYVEIGQSPDKTSGWQGEKQEFYNLYRTVATHLKEKFPRIKVGAYSAAGFYALNRYDGTGAARGYIDFLEGFLSYITKKPTAAPLDFLSWECLANTPEELSLHANYAASYLSQYGLRRAESIISAFNLEGGNSNCTARAYPSALAASLIIAEKSSVSAMFYDTLDPRNKKCAALSLDEREIPHKYAAYHILRAYGKLYSLGTAIETTEDFRREIYSLAALGSAGGAVLITTRDFSGMIEVEAKGSAFSAYSIFGIVGGGTRGVGHSSGEDNIPISNSRIRLRVGKDEVYLITFK